MLGHVKLEIDFQLYFLSHFAILRLKKMLEDGVTRKQNLFQVITYISSYQ